MQGQKVNPQFQPQNNKQAYLAYLCGLDIALPEPRTAEEILLCKMCADGVGGGFAGLDFSGCSFDAYGMGIVFKSLKDVTAEGGNQIILTGNPCVTGIGILESRVESARSYDDVCEMFEDVLPDVPISIEINGGGLVAYSSLKSALTDLAAAPYPCVIYWTDMPRSVAKLTDDDFAIAKNKGWEVVI